jgi:phosphopantothenoylcysteine decarboxylase
MAKVLLGVTGSVAAIRTPLLAGLLRERGHAVKVVATAASLYFFDPQELDPAHPGRNPEVVVLDSDEWPGRDAGRRYQRGDAVLHIELRNWADVLCVAPLDANTLARLAGGLCDNCLTCVWRAWDPARPVVLAPAMNTFMWQHPLTEYHLRLLAAEQRVPLGHDLDGVVAFINRFCPRLRVVAPVSKRLACGDVGVGALAELADIVAAVEEVLSAPV